MPTRHNVSISVLRFGVWGALLYPGLLILGWWVLADFVPPPDPGGDEREILNHYRERSDLIRAGMVVTMFGAVMAMPLGATVAYLIRRIEGTIGPLTMLQIMGAVGMAVLTFFPPMWWLIALFRLDRNPELTLMLSDAGWLQWVGGLTIYYPTIITMAVAALTDSSERPLFPRWFGYLNLWLVLLLLPGQLIFFFKDGPFAWNGIISFYLAFVVFGLWFPVAFRVLGRAVRQLQAESEIERTPTLGPQSQAPVTT